MFDAGHILQAGGLLAVGATIFAETGLLLGIFLPGDTLLLTAGLFAGEDKLSIFWLNVVVIFAAFMGYEAGYAIGERAGAKIFKRQTGLLFRKDYIKKTRDFFNKYGEATLIIARLIANVRTFVPLIAGAAKMDKKRYMIYNLLGAALWSVLVTLLGYGLGSTVPHIDRYFFPVLLGGLVVLYLIAVGSIIKSPARRTAIKKGLREDWDYFFSHHQEN